MPHSIQSIADIPFLEQDPWTLLNVQLRGPFEPGAPDHGDDEAMGPDLEYTGFGYARVDSLWLTGENERDPMPPVRNVLLLALHSADDGDPMASDILLEFWLDELDEDGEPLVVTALLSRFLAVWLPRLSSDETAVVLALCNPHRARLVRPPLPGDQPVYYAFGDVISGLDAPGDHFGARPVLRLVADEWRSV